VTGHVGGKALQVQRLLRIALSKVLAVSGTVIVLVLPQVDHHWNFTSCHNLNPFLFFCTAKVRIIFILRKPFSVGIHVVQRYYTLIHVILNILFFFILRLI
jgi:hypothetical protein